MSRRDVLNYVLKQYRRGEISLEEFQAWMKYNPTLSIGAKIELTTKRILARLAEK